MASRSCDGTLTFTPFESTLGGALIGASAAALLLGHGRRMDFSCVVADVFISISQRKPVETWHALVLIGLILGGVFATRFSDADTPFPVDTLDYPAAAYAIAGTLVGFGTSMSSGCTFGHSVYGLGQESKRSQAAVYIFVAVATITSSVAIQRYEGCAKDPDVFFFAPLAFPSSWKFDVLPLLGGAVVPIVFLCMSALMALDWPMPNADEASGSYTPRRVVSWFVHGCLQLSIGLTAGVGLVLGGVLDQTKVRGFLNIFGGPWDPSLAFVIASGAAICYAAHRYASRQQAPFLAPRFPVDDVKEEIDANLVAGAVVFGIGWGLVGICPAPAIVGLAGPIVGGASWGPVWRFPLFLAAFAFGSFLARNIPHEALPNLLERLKRTMTIYGLLNDEESGLGGSPPRGAGESTML